MRNPNNALLDAAIAHARQPSNLFLAVPRIAMHEALGPYLHRVSHLSWTNAVQQIADRTLGYPTGQVNLCIPANIPGIVEILGEVIPAAHAVRRLHTLFPLSRLVGDGAARGRVEVRTMSRPQRADQLHFSRRQAGITWALGLCAACIEEDFKEYESAVWHREHLLRLSNVCALHCEPILEYCESCLLRVRRTTRLPMPSLACICGERLLTTRRPTVRNEKNADHGLSVFTFEFLNSTEVEHLNGELLAEAVGDRLGHIGARGESQLHYGRLRDVFASKLSRRVLDMLPDPRTSPPFRRALKGLQPFGDASTALAVCYALFGSVEELARTTSAERVRPNYRQVCKEAIRRRGSQMTPAQRHEVTLGYLHRLEIPGIGEGKLTRTQFKKRAGVYIYTWFQEYGGEFLPPPDSYMYARNQNPSGDLADRDARMAAHVKSRARVLRAAEFTGRISKNILLQGFPGGNVCCGKNSWRYPQTHAALDGEVETLESWHARITNGLIREANRVGIASDFIPCAEMLESMTNQQHKNLRARLKKLIKSRDAERIDLKSSGSGTALFSRGGMDEDT